MGGREFGPVSPSGEASLSPFRVGSLRPAFVHSQHLAHGVDSRPRFGGTLGVSSRQCLADVEQFGVLVCDGKCRCRGHFRRGGRCRHRGTHG